MARPRKKDAIDISAVAIRTAVDLMRRKGDTGFSLAELAAEIGCSAPALYNHFSNKNALLLKVRDAVHFERLAEKEERYSGSETDALERLQDGGLAYLAFARRNPALYRLLYCPSPELITAGGNDIIRQDSLTTLSKGVQACQAQGYVTSHDAEAFAYTMWSLAHGAALLALDQTSSAQEDAWVQAERTILILINLIRETRTII